MDAAPFNPPAWCPECGYALTGLPAAGRCPECGWEYGTEIVLFAPLDVAASQRIISIVAYAGIGIGWGWMAIRSFAGSRWMFATFAGGAAMLWGYFSLRAVVRGRRGGLRVQARFGTRGFAGRAGPGPVYWMPWRAGDEPALVKVKPLGEPSSGGEIFRFVLVIQREAIIQVGRMDQVVRIDLNATAAEARAVRAKLVSLRDAAVAGGERVG